MDFLEQLYGLILVIFTNVELLTLAIIILAIFANVGRRIRERRPMRPIAALDNISKMSGMSIEASQPLHFSIGSATIGDETTVIAMLGSEFLHYAARQVAVGDAPPLFTVSDSTALPLATDTLRRAYEAENRPYAFNRFNMFSNTLLSTRWYPAGRRSLAFAAALMTIQADDEISGNIMVGRYGIELGLVLDAAYRHDNQTIATSDQLDGQAIAYGLAGDALIGEEVFTAASYIGDNPNLQNRAFAIDRLRVFVVAAIIIIIVARLVTGG